MGDKRGQMLHKQLSLKVENTREKVTRIFSYKLLNLENTTIVSTVFPKFKLDASAKRKKIHRATRVYKC